MLFNSLEFVTFFAVVFAVYWLVAHLRRVPVAFLLAASYLFYACWDVRFLGLIVASSTIDFVAGARIAAATRDGPRRGWLALSIVYNLGALAIFKYFDFFAVSFDALFDAMGRPAVGVRLDVLLPVGISFFTFQSMSYTIDVYRRQLDPCRSYARYLLYVAFFPQLVAGPIVRARDLLPQLAARPALTEAAASRGLWLVAIGLVKKVAIADTLALGLVDRVFTLPHQFSAVEALAGVYAYALQIYCDFSGYSDIAIGAALLLGFRFDDNFDAPYQAKNPQEFWRRWHISLSTWLRDYLYLPLGGSRKGTARTYFNLMATMLLGGLWHGAAWSFVAWGALHGGALVLHRLYRSRVPAGPDSRLRRVVSRLAMFHFACLAWVFFRAPSFGDAVAVLERFVGGGLSVANLTPTLLGVLAIGYLGHFAPPGLGKAALARFTAWPAPVQALALASVCVVVLGASTSDVVPFIYFQF